MTRMPRAAITLLVAALCTAALARRASAAPQDTTRAVLDSLTERLERAEHALERLQTQLQDQERSKVGSRQRNHVELSGTVLMNGFYSNAKVNNSDVPTFVVDPQDTTGLPNGYGGAQVRQSRIGLTMRGTHALGASLTGDLQLDFYGAQPNASGARPFPVPRIRTASVRLDWRHLGLLMGQEAQIISPWTPSGFAAVGVPGFTNAGNLWFWMPQVRLTYETGARPRIGLQGAAVAPNFGFSQPSYSVASQPDSAEKSRRPFVQGRAYIGWGDGETETQIGVGVHRGWIATTGDTLLTSSAVTVDGRIALGEKILLMGEAFTGSALASLGGGGIGQELGAGGIPVDTRGGWVQLNLRPSFAWELGGGWGMDDPDDTDLPATGRMKNMHAEGHLHWRPGGGLILGGEVLRLQTTYQSVVQSAWHVNFFSGLSF
jgi:hypothetical protein